MTCEYCLVNFAANSHEELQNRLESMKAYPQVRVMHCPVCGGTDWATTDAMIPREQLDDLSGGFLMLVYAGVAAGLLAVAGVCFYLMR